jgi:hypothetical protein
MRNRNNRGWQTLIFWAIAVLIFTGAVNYILPLIGAVAAIGLAYWVISRFIGFTGPLQNYTQQRTQSRPSNGGQWRDAGPNTPAARRRPLPSEQIAERALRNAGNLPTARGIRLEDVGIFAYDGGPKPTIRRSEAVSAAATHLRPFMVLNLPYQQGGTGRIIFELVDDQGEVRFVADHRYKIRPGQNFITPSTWLPMGDEEAGGNWALRISIGDQVLALHHFEITPDAGATFRPYLREDGEVDEWMVRSAQTEETGKLSLDDLLADQEEIDIDMFREANKLRQVGERRS